MIDCLSCYRLHRHGDTLYCPFFGLKECIRGEHYINCANRTFKPKPEELPPLPPPPLPPKAVIKTPEFKPFPGSPQNWEEHHDKLFEMRKQGMSTYKIADALGLTQSSVFNYLKRYQ